MHEEHGKTKHMQKQRHKQRQSTNMTLIKCLAHFNFISNLRMQMLSLPLGDYDWKFRCQHFFKPPWPLKLVSALSATLPLLLTIKKYIHWQTWSKASNNIFLMSGSLSLSLLSSMYWRSGGSFSISSSGNSSGPVSGSSRCGRMSTASLNNHWWLPGNNIQSTQDQSISLTTLYHQSLEIPRKQRTFTFLLPRSHW